MKEYIVMSKDGADRFIVLAIDEEDAIGQVTELQDSPSKENLIASSLDWIHRKMGSNIIRF